MAEARATRSWGNDEAAEPAAGVGGKHPCAPEQLGRILIRPRQKVAGVRVRVNVVDLSKRALLLDDKHVNAQLEQGMGLQSGKLRQRRDRNHGPKLRRGRGSRS